VLFVGEAPGRSEDELGEPFLGRAGKLLDTMLSTLQEKYTFSYGITNIVCCMPTERKDGKEQLRPPTDKEANACRPKLENIISICNPKLVVTLGKTAYTHLPESVQESAVPVCELQHPAYILRKGGIDSVEYKRNLLTLDETIEGFCNNEQPKAKQKKAVKKRTSKTKDKGSSTEKKKAPRKKRTRKE